MYGPRTSRLLLLLGTPERNLARRCLSGVLDAQPVLSFAVELLHCSGAAPSGLYCSRVGLRARLRVALSYALRLLSDHYAVYTRPTLLNCTIEAVDSLVSLVFGVGVDVPLTLSSM